MLTGQFNSGAYCVVRTLRPPVVKAPTTLTLQVKDASTMADAVVRTVLTY